MNTISTDSSKSFIIDFWSQIFEFLGKFTLYDLILRSFSSLRSPEYERKVGKYEFVEVWVLGHLIVSILVTFFSNSAKIPLWEPFFFFYGGWRVYEVVIYQINVVFFGQSMAEKKGEQYVIRGFLRIVILLLHNFVEIIFWFAFFYRNLPNAFNDKISSFIYSIIFSFYTMTTFGHSNVTPINKMGYVLTSIQAFTGLFMALIVVSRFIAFLPKPRTLENSKIRRKSVGTIPNIGKKRVELLKNNSIITVGDFLETNEDELKNILKLNPNIIQKMKRDAELLIYKNNET